VIDLGTSGVLIDVLSDAKRFEFEQQVVAPQVKSTSDPAWQITWQDVRAEQPAVTGICDEA
jgi:hypothetical protein